MTEAKGMHAGESKNSSEDKRQFDPSLFSRKVEVVIKKDNNPDDYGSVKRKNKERKRINQEKKVISLQELSSVAESEEVKTRRIEKKFKAT